MARYRKRPLEIEAFQWTGDENQLEDPLWIVEAIKSNLVYFATVADELMMYIRTNEGIMRADPGDWIIRGIEDELYPCKPDIFKQTYELVE